MNAVATQTVRNGVVLTPEQQALALSGARADGHSTIRPDEQPLFVGNSKFTLAHKPIKMSVSVDDDWFWVRFAKALDDNQKGDLYAHGAQYSKKKRLGWWFPVTPPVVAYLRELGYRDAKLPDLQVITPAQQVEAAHVKVVDNGVTMAQSKPLPPEWEAAGVRRNKAGRLTIEGRFISAEKIAALVEKGGGKPPVDNDEGDGDEGDEYSREYLEGYETGKIDGQNEDVPGIYNRLDLAKYLSMTLTQMQSSFGDEFLVGYLVGFEDVRPKPAPAKPQGIREWLAAHRGK